MNPGIADELLRAGLSPAEAESKAEIFRRCEEALKIRAAESTGAPVRCYVPGRIEVLGKHTDYAGGRSLLCAVERGICAVAVPRSDHVVRMTDVLREQECQFAVSPELDPRSDNWAIYPKTVARRLARNFPGRWVGMDMAFGSDLPRASGMSSSSALLTATYLLLEQFNGLSARPEFERDIRSPEERATYIGCIENGQTFGPLQGDAGVGTFGGSEDHVAILCSKPGTLRQYRFCPARREREVPLPGELTFVIAVSGVTADKTGTARGKYNSVSLAAREILSIWREATGRGDATLFDAATHASDAPGRIRRLLGNAKGTAFSSEALLNRFEQFFEESTQIVPGAAEALEAKKLDAFGRCVDRSQELAEQKLGNQIPQTVELARSARALGAIAASAFGAGFGGSVWAMVRKDIAEEFLTRWDKGYKKEYPMEAGKSSFFTSGAGPAAFVF
ncbi:MAG TPA: galactokinase family protein [Candidatus Angelobacter sp.]|nr:galactokinase family protein [Candidatus Angelobacter sp.]